MGDIEEAVTHLQGAVNLTAEGHPSKPGRINNLGRCLLTRFERLGNSEDIDGAIIQHQAAVNLTPDGHPSKPQYLSNLGDDFKSRFLHFHHS
jgi:hypothetical protein